jgi:hypothetical protein
MEKNKKDLKNYVLVVGGSRGELDDVLVVVESGLNIKEYLEIISKREIDGLMESCVSEEEEDDMRGYIDEFGIGVVEKYDSSKGFDVYGVCLGEESSMLMFEGNEEDIEDVEGWDDIEDCLGIRI